MGLIAEALRNIAKKPVTQKYPAVKPKIPFNLRGKVVHIKERCIYCGICAKHCPSHAITVDIKNKIWKIDYGRCLFCQQCEESCREIIKKDAIKLSSIYELVETDKNEMIREDREEVIPQANVKLSQ